MKLFVTIGSNARCEPVNTINGAKTAITKIVIPGIVLYKKLIRIPSNDPIQEPTGPVKHSAIGTINKIVKNGTPTYLIASGIIFSINLFT